MIYECTNAYYFSSLNAIGGIESHLYYIARKYGKDYDITIVIRSGDKTQIDRLKQYVNVIEFDITKDKLYCEQLFCCFNTEILDRCDAKSKNLVLHGDYLDMVNREQIDFYKLPLDNRIDKYYGVSQLVCDSWEKLTHNKATNLYQPIVLDPIDKPLMLISATRLSKEKGYERMCNLARFLELNDVNYVWTIYTNDHRKPSFKGMQLVNQRLDVANILTGYDAFVQLSDNEGYCLSVVEALLRGVPCIVTDLPVLKELGCNEENSIILKHDMSNLDIKQIKAITKKKFKYEQPQDKWLNVLVKGSKKSLIKVKTTKAYKVLQKEDILLGYIPEPNEIMIVSEKRYNELTNNSFGVKFVERIDDGDLATTK